MSGHVAPEVQQLLLRPLNTDEAAVLSLARKAPVRAGPTYNCAPSTQWEATRTHVLRTLVVATLKTVRGNQCEAARQLGMHRNTLKRILEGNAA